MEKLSVSSGVSTGLTFSQTPRDTLMRVQMTMQSKIYAKGEHKTKQSGAIGGLLHEKKRKKMLIVSSVSRGVLEKLKSVDTPDDTLKFSKIRIHGNRCVYECTITIQRKIHATKDTSAI